MRSKRKSRRGASGVEYALLVGLIAVGAIVAINATGTAVVTVFTGTANVMQTAAADGSAASGGSGSGGSGGGGVTVIGLSCSGVVPGGYEPFTGTAYNDIADQDTADLGTIIVTSTVAPTADAPEIGGSSALLMVPYNLKVSCDNGTSHYTLDSSGMAECSFADGSTSYPKDGWGLVGIGPSCPGGFVDNICTSYGCNIFWTG